MVDQECSDAYVNHYKLMVEALDEVAPHNRDLYFSVRGWLRSFFEAGYDAGKLQPTTEHGEGKESVSDSKLDSFAEWIEGHLPDGWEWDLRFRTGTECAWEAEVRLTPRPNRMEGPDVSTVLFISGGETPEELAARLETAIRLHVSHHKRE